MILPSAHVWLQGADRLIANYVEQRRASGLLPVKFLYVAKQVAQNKIEFTPLIEAIRISATIVVMTLVVWLLARWRTVRLSVGSAATAVSVALLAEMAFHVALYLAVWAFFGADHLKIDWQNVVPTSLAVLGGSGWVRRILITLSIGALLRLIVLGGTLRRMAPSLPARAEWLVASGAAAAVVIATVLSSGL